MAAEACLGAIARAKGSELVASCSLSPAQCKVLRAVADCRTPALGGHRDQCDTCGYQHLFWNSCRDRHCPGCGAEARAAWLEARQAELLDVPYFHVVLTLPEILRPLALHAPEIVYAILVRSAGQALLDLGRSRLGAQLGILAVLHTWTQKLEFHPHVHCIVPGGGFALDGRRWIAVKKMSFLFSVKALSRRFRTLVTHAIREAYHEGTLTLPPSIPDPRALQLLLARSWKTDWHGYIKPPFAGARHVLGYLAAYTHRIAISNHRILAFDGDTVSFAWRDRSDGGARKTMTLDAVEFLRRFLMHVVPPRFVRIRYYGFMANSHRHAMLDKARELLRMAQPVLHVATPATLRTCPQCHQGRMVACSPILPQSPRTWFDTPHQKGPCTAVPTRP